MATKHSDKLALLSHEWYHVRLQYFTLVSYHVCHFNHQNVNPIFSSVCNGNVEGTRLQLKPKKPPDTIKNGTEMTQQMVPRESTT
jgi:hypothetical protein